MTNEERKKELELIELIELTEWQAFCETRCWQAIKAYFEGQATTQVKIFQSFDEALVHNAALGRILGISSVLNFPDKMIQDLRKKKEK